MPSKSKKQARLMAAVAHNPRFAKKVGIPQSVGREFNDADQKLAKYADGGKVKTLKRMSELLKDPMSHSMWSEDSPRYQDTLKRHEWDPEIDPTDFSFMTGYAEGNLWGWKDDSPHIKRMDELIRKYGLRPRDTTLWRGLEVPPDVVSTWKPGDILRNRLPSSVSTERQVADEFANIGAWGDERVPALIRIAPSSRKALPIPQSGQSELVMPSGDAGRLGIDKIRYNPRTDTYELEAEAVPHPGFGEGGEVLPSSTEDDEEWSDTYIKRPLSGLASMWGGTDPETGEFVNPAWHNIKRILNADARRKAGLPRQKMATLGIVDEAISLPALGEIVGLPAPQFAKDAEARSSATREAARDAIGVDAPHGFTENLTESAGVMAGQLPVPASWANKLKLLKESGKLGKAGKILGPAAEWFSPTVVPKAKNYLQGTLFGGGVGGALDYLEDHEAQEERNKQFISEAMAEVLEEERAGAAQESGDDSSDDEALAELGYAEGGRVKQVKRVARNLRQILSDDSSDDAAARKVALDQALSAIRGMYPTEPPPVVASKAGPVPQGSGTIDPAEFARRVLNKQLVPAPPEVIEPTATPVRNFLSQPPKVNPTGPGPLRQGSGDWDPNEFARRVLSKYHTRGAQPELVDETVRLDQEDRDWNKMFGYATGGVVTNQPWMAEQSQKNLEGFDAPPPNNNRPDAPLSQGWYEHYGEGPEHLFLGDRKMNLPEDWQPIRPGPAQAPRSSGGGGSSTLSNIVGLASLGLMGYDVYNDIWGGDNQDYQIDPSILEGAQGIEGDTTWLDNEFANMPMPTAEYDPSLWDRTQQGAGGAFDIYTGSQQGGAAGLGSMIEGGGDVYQAFGGKEAFGDIAGNVGGILQGVGDGTVQGYLQAGGDAAQLAQAMGYTGPVTDAAGNLLPVVGQLFSAYQGIQQGDPAGYAQAAGALAGAYGTVAGASLGGAAAAGPIAALGFAIADASNYALDHDDRRNQLYASRMQFTPIKMTNIGKMPGSTFYQMSNGKIISQKDMEWLSRLSKNTGKGNAEADAAHAKAVQDLMADNFHSNDFNARQRAWLEANYPGKY